LDGLITMRLNFIDLAAKLGVVLRKKKWSVVTAESCTGGMVAQSITAISGSSVWFERGFVTYSNLAKRESLGVKSLTLKKHGAVSDQTAKEMAEGALANSHAQVSVAITGIAGPSGGTKNKPVGTVYFAVAGKNRATQIFLQHFSGDRDKVRKQATQFALQQLIFFIEKIR
jgi:nicotinamide-nucleotide amidase